MSFYNVLSQYYDIIFPSNPIQMDFIKKYIQKEKIHILDLAAGSGNQAIELARLNHHVTAVDLDPEMVNKMKQKSSTDLNNETNLKTAQLDMRDVNHFNNHSFDTVLCIGNSIVHLPSVDEIKDTIQKIYYTLKEQGTFIVQVVNYDRILDRQVTKLPLIERQENGVTFIRTYTHKDKKIIFNGELVIEQNGMKEVYKNSVELYPLSSNELLEALKEAGFKSVHLFGDFKGIDFSMTTPALIAVAQK